MAPCYESLIWKQSVYIYICIEIHTYIHTCVRTYIHMYINIYVYVYIGMCVYIYMYICTCIQLYLRLSMFLFICCSFLCMYMLYQLRGPDIRPELRKQEESKPTTKRPFLRTSCHLHVLNPKTYTPTTTSPVTDPPPRRHVICHQYLKIVVSRSRISRFLLGGIILSYSFFCGMHILWV